TLFRSYLRYGQSEYGMFLKSHFFQLSVKGSGYHGPGIAQFHARACTVRSAGPSGIYQPYVNPRLFHFGTEHLCVFGGMQGHERSSEACGEGRYGFVDTRFGTRYFGGITGDEMICRLTGCKPGNRGEDTKCVCRKKKYI